MADDYTPTPEEARDWFIIGVHHAGDGARYPDTGEAFDRMLAAVEAKALRDAADRFPGSLPLGMTERDWLRTEASRIEADRG